MDARALRREIEAFDVDLPIERAWTPPSSWYVEPAIAALERRQVWRRTWQWVARTEQLRAPGQYVATIVADEPILIVRTDTGELTALANTCRHKATQVCTGAGRASELVCPYHGWSYHLDGRLKSAPHVGGIRDLDRDALSLPRLRVEAWGPWVFVNQDPDAAPLSDLVLDLDAELESGGWRELLYRASERWVVECNWKAFCDNYLDGGYHIPHMHPTLDAQLDMSSYRTALFDRYSVQSAGRGEGTGVPLSVDPAQRIAGGARYVWIYPNFMINRYGPALDVNVVRPLGPELCEVEFHWWFEPDVDPEFVTESIAQSTVTQREDVQVSKWVQTGLRSASYDRGRYAPALETGAHHFHRLLACDLRRGLPPP